MQPSPSPSFYFLVPLFSPQGNFPGGMLLGACLIGPNSTVNGYQGHGEKKELSSPSPCPWWYSRNTWSSYQKHVKLQTWMTFVVLFVVSIVCNSNTSVMQYQQFTAVLLVYSSTTGVQQYHQCAAIPLVWCSTTSVVQYYYFGAIPLVWCSTTGVVQSYQCDAVPLVYSSTTSVQQYH